MEFSGRGLIGKLSRRSCVLFGASELGEGRVIMDAKTGDASESKVL